LAKRKVNLELCRHHVKNPALHEKAGFGFDEPTRYT
jgi:hypothetical protein